MLSIKSTLDLLLCRNNFWKSRTFFAFCSVQNRSTLNSTDDTFDVDEEELEKKRYQSRLPQQVIRKFIKNEVVPPGHREDFQIKNLRRRYGRYGEKSGLNPGIAWPTREELLEKIKYDKLFCKPLREMLDNVNAAEEEKMRQRLEYEAEVEKNMKKMETYKKEYYDKIAKKKKEEEDRILKQQLLIEEISELLGYDVSPKDPKFQEAVEMKKKEEKKAKRMKKQQETYDRMLAKLSNIAASTKKTGQTAENEDMFEDTTEQADKSSETSPVNKEPLSESK